MAKDDGAFVPIDINPLDSFPMDMCSRLISLMFSAFKDASLCMYFQIAAQVYFIDELTTNLLNTLSSSDILTDKTSFPSTFKLTLAFIRYLLHRASLSSFDDHIHYVIVEGTRSRIPRTNRSPFLQISWNRSFIVPSSHSSLNGRALKRLCWRCIQGWSVFGPRVDPQSAIFGPLYNHWSKS
ncbi:hypothetical protein EDD85DRAFT_12604 [Armillaria nabsnona]|nr:hypothetical protein EDD85DRAFT_12604 [Armillaria nabsnona]